MVAAKAEKIKGRLNESFKVDSAYSSGGYSVDTVGYVIYLWGFVECQSTEQKMGPYTYAYEDSSGLMKTHSSFWQGL